MKLSLNWLQDYIDLNGIKPEQIMGKLTMATCEVEHFSEIYTYLERIQVAKIQSVEKHPNADKLSICKVQTSPKEVVQIVCGAPNVEENMLVALATIGTHLPTSEAHTSKNNAPQKDSLKDSLKTSLEAKEVESKTTPTLAKEFWEVAPANIRGVTSKGMLCSSQELAIHHITQLYLTQDTGILNLTEFFLELEKYYPTLSKKINTWKTLGTPLSKIFPLHDIIFNIDNKSITHRPDLWSHYGFARELSSIFNKPLKNDPYKTKIKKINPKVPQKKIYAEKDVALAYFGVHVQGVQVKPSPIKIQARLLAVGARPINNIVDVSNYIMYDLGQPNHIFDAKKLHHKEISVIGIKRNEKRVSTKFTALDGIERDLPQESILILDGLIKDTHLNKNSKGPSKAKIENVLGPSMIALGGIIGGESSMIQKDTQELFIESATFPRSRIRKTIQTIGIRTDAAQRFEKGQDPAKALPALHHLLFLLSESCPSLQIGKVSGKVFVPIKENTIEISTNEIESRLGLTKDSAYFKKILERLHFKVKILPPSPKQVSKNNSTNFHITVPTYRSQYDLSIPEDIIEEIGRLHGFDYITPCPPDISLTPPLKNQKRILTRFIKDYLAYGLNFNESYNYSFTNKKNNVLFSGKPITLANPVFENKNEMRLSLLPGLLENLEANQDRFNEVRIFEMGRTYQELRQEDNIEIQTSKIIERTEIALAFMPSQKNISTNDSSQQEILLNHLIEMRKGLETLFKKVIGGHFHFKRELQENERIPYLHPKALLQFEVFRVKDIEGSFGEMGLLHPEWQKNFSLKRSCIVASIYFEKLFDVYEKVRNTFHYAAPSIFPNLHFELSLLLPIHCSSYEPIQIVQKLNLLEIDEMYYLNEYQGSPLSPEQKSVSYAIVCSRRDKTLNSEELQIILEKVVSHLQHAGFQLRS